MKNPLLMKVNVTSTFLAVLLSQAFFYPIDAQDNITAALPLIIDRASPDGQKTDKTDTTGRKAGAVFQRSAGHGFALPGEAIRLSAYPDTGSFVNGFYTIDGDGRIYLPIIGKMTVSGMSEKAFLDTLKAQYINYLRYPNLQVRRLVRVSLLGGFQKPGLFYIDPDYSLWDAVYLTGGTIHEDGLKRMKWERNRQIVAEDIIPYYQSGQSLRSIGFQSGDQLWTPIEPKRNWYDIIVKDVVLAQIFPIITTTATLYISYLVYQTSQKR
jgi:protein involved in polysaccharide export with SLBB domain